MYCKHADVFGRPGEGVHSTRVGGYALFDIIGTFLLAVITTYLFRVNIFVSFLGWFILAEILHYMFCVKTAFLKEISLA